VGWSLSDRTVSVRKAAIKAVVNLYSLEREEVHQKLYLFCTRFKKRFEEMSKDIDRSVSALAVDLMTKLLSVGVLQVCVCVCMRMCVCIMV
jgi:hypothetical protein